MKKNRMLLPYRQAVPSMILYRAVAFALKQGWQYALSLISRLLLHSSGRVAVTSGDFIFLFTTWQGILLIILTFITLFFYIAIDINALIILCDRLLRGEKPSVFGCLGQGFVSLKKLLNPYGMLVVLYLTLISPITGFGISITLTQNFYIPNFITSVIYKNPLYTVGFFLVLLLLSAVGLMFIYILHGALLDDLILKDSARQSLRLIKRYWKSFLAASLCFLAFNAIAFSISFVVALAPQVISLLLSDRISQAGEIVLLFFLTAGLLMIISIISYSQDLYVMMITKQYMIAKSDKSWTYKKRKNRKSPVVIIFIAVMFVISAAVSVPGSFYSDRWVKSKYNAEIIAHRAGGDCAAENTAAGIDAAYKFGAFGSEIDIQRTKDGYYVVNHDDTFARVANVNKKPSEMTLAEVKQLRVDNEPVPTLEEMLDSCKGRLTLFVELKGETADRQMADDAVRIIRERNMDSEAVIISLKYDLIKYIEEKYPGIVTGYLAFASFGDTAGLSCDYLMLEQETADESVIESIHVNGKKVYIWTVDYTDDIEKYMRGNADGIITDNIKGASEVKKKISEYSSLQIISHEIIDMLITQNGWINNTKALLNGDINVRVHS
ncbi:MAG: glycerophosphoryl diester phosphodiesterase membrane domain-containing protein [Ruminococcus sp.]|nr:glycerophosphoryl diester phosphodiesterase membrane domain-containing protein [Ruminococcus sp.]